MYFPSFTRLLNFSHTEFILFFLIKIAQSIGKQSAWKHAACPKTYTATPSHKHTHRHTDTCSTTCFVVTWLCVCRKVGNTFCCLCLQLRLEQNPQNALCGAHCCFFLCLPLSRSLSLALALSLSLSFLKANTFVLAAAVSPLPSLYSHLEFILIKGTNLSTGFCGWLSAFSFQLSARRHLFCMQMLKQPQLHLRLMKASRNSCGRGGGRCRLRVLPALIMHPWRFLIWLTWDVRRAHKLRCSKWQLPVASCQIEATVACG